MTDQITSRDTLAHFSSVPFENPESFEVLPPRRFEGPYHRDAVLVGARAVVLLVKISEHASNVETENQELRAELITEAEAARTDTLTGLPNLRAFEEFYAAVESRGDLNDYAMLHLDIDFFKDVNDKLGYEVGDEVLQAIGTIFGRLFNKVRKDEIIARVGGDEFIVFVKKTVSGNHRRDPAKTPDRVVRGLKNRIREKFKKEVAEEIDIKADDENPRLSVSIGSACYVEGDTLASWKKRAEKEMKKDKSARGAAR